MQKKGLFGSALALAILPLAMSSAWAADAPKLPYCSAKVTDSCQQTAAQQARAMTGEQADKRDAKTGTWTPNKRATPAAPQPK